MLTKSEHRVLQTELLKHSDHTYFITGRYIGQYTRRVYDIMHYTKTHKTPGILLLISRRAEARDFYF